MITFDGETSPWATCEKPQNPYARSLIIRIGAPGALEPAAAEARGRRVAIDAPVRARLARGRVEQHFPR